MSQIKESDLDQIGGGMRFPGELVTPPYIPEDPLPGYPNPDFPCPLPYNPYPVAYA
jgi:hypothetical protein